LSEDVRGRKPVQGGGGETLVPKAGFLEQRGVVWGNSRESKTVGKKKRKTEFKEDFT